MEKLLGKRMEHKTIPITTQFYYVKTEYVYTKSQEGNIEKF